MGGSSGQGGHTPGDGGSAKVIGFAAIAAGVLWLASGFYIVDQGERGVVLRFGQYVQTYKDEELRNSNPGQTLGSIYLVSTRNL